MKGVLAQGHDQLEVVLASQLLLQLLATYCLQGFLLLGDLQAGCIDSGWLDTREVGRHRLRHSAGIGRWVNDGRSTASRVTLERVTGVLPVAQATRVSSHRPVVPFDQSPERELARYASFV